MYSIVEQGHKDSQRTHAISWIEDSLLCSKEGVKENENGNLTLSAINHNSLLEASKAEFGFQF
jgi:hypothetical protein